MRISELQDKIRSLKKETDTAVLAHSYQAREIVEIADCVGDSYQISEKAKERKEKNLLLCGVRFMAETVKILNPGKRTYIANAGAGCPMADGITAETLKKLKEAEPDRAVAAYINTSAEVKKLADVCVTSSSAVKIVKNMDAEKILFIPDQNLGAYVKKAIPEKDIMLFGGGCPYHSAVTAGDADRAKGENPGALLLVHPECPPEVAEKADYIGSTYGIMEFVKNSSCGSFIIGTENSITEHLEYEYPGKTFIPLSKKLICPDMKLTTLYDIYKTLASIRENKTDNRGEIIMSGEDIRRAGSCIAEMLRLGN